MYEQKGTKMAMEISLNIDYLIRCSYIIKNFINHNGTVVHLSVSDGYLCYATTDGKHLLELKEEYNILPADFMPISIVLKRIRTKLKELSRTTDRVILNVPDLALQHIIRTNDNIPVEAKLTRIKRTDLECSLGGIKIHINLNKFPNYRELISQKFIPGYPEDTEILRKCAPEFDGKHPELGKGIFCWKNKITTFIQMTNFSK
jgi:hypothetical protein